MKVIRKKFVPILIMLETQTEYDAILELLNHEPTLETEEYEDVLELLLQNLEEI